MLGVAKELPYLSLQRIIFPDGGFCRIFFAKHLGLEGENQVIRGIGTK